MLRADQDQRVVMTLDAGGTNFVFSAIQANREIVEPLTLPSHAHDLQRCLQTIVAGFREVQAAVHDKPVAISFAFPGPSDYPSGVIGDLGNLPAFRGGVALGPMLQEQFQLPVFINNDGDLFTYGEAICGFLPHVNELLRAGGSHKRYQNLFGITVGTGFGAGIVSRGELFVGDNAAAAEIWLMRDPLRNRLYIEEGTSIRAVQRAYVARSRVQHAQTPSPKEIYEFAKGHGGDQAAALEAYRTLGETIGNALAAAINLVDGLVVVGGGLSGAAELFLPRVVAELNGTLESVSGTKMPRMESTAFNLEDPQELQAFIQGQAREIVVPGTERRVVYDPLKRIGIGVSRLGTSRAVSLGAYALALHNLERPST